MAIKCAMIPTEQVEVRVTCAVLNALDAVLLMIP